jgi:hypothetical protein
MEQETVKGLAFNYNRSESVMKFYDAAQLQGLLQRYLPVGSGLLLDRGKPLQETIKEMNQGISLWKLFIILALIFLGIEIIILRFWNLGR